jgi:hypothetical protein
MSDNPQEQPTEGQVMSEQEMVQLVVDALSVIMNARLTQYQRDELAKLANLIRTLQARLKAVEGERERKLETALENCAYALFSVKHMGVDDTVFAFCEEHYEKAIAALPDPTKQQES